MYNIYSAYVNYKKYKKYNVTLFGLRRSSFRKTWSHVCAFNAQSVSDTNARASYLRNSVQKNRKNYCFIMSFMAHIADGFSLLVHINTSQSNFRQIVYSYYLWHVYVRFLSELLTPYTCVGALIKITIFFFFLSLFLFYLYSFNQRNTTK